MLIVADTSPLNYLILIDAVDVLSRLYGTVVVPRVVFEELSDRRSPEKVRSWAGRIPTWIEVREPAGAVAMMGLDLGEASAIALANELKADRLLIDEKDGRNVAKQMGIAILGTAGVLRDAAKAGLVDLRAALDRLQQTSFRASPEFFEKVLRDFERSE